MIYVRYDMIAVKCISKAKHADFVTYNSIYIYMYPVIIIMYKYTYFLSVHTKSF